MNKNDRLITITGVLVLIIASIGVITWQAQDSDEQTALIHHFYGVESIIHNTPDAIAVCDSSPFYALIATPLAIHYTPDGIQHTIPLFVKNHTDPSRAIMRAMDQINRRVDLYLDSTYTPQDWSNEIAQQYWTQSDAALIMQDTEEGYNLGLIATPLASYLGIPVIVTHDMNQSVLQTLSMLQVKKTIVCGNELAGYGEVLRLSTMQDIVNITIDLIFEKFGALTYIGIANPMDAWPPEVLATETFSFEKTIPTGATTEIVTTLRNKGGTTIGTFTIPKDYKYTLIKFRGINEQVENVDELGDEVHFMVGPMLDDLPGGLQSSEAHAGGTNSGGIPVRDAQGNIIIDQTYDEAVVYDRGGVEYRIGAGGSWLAHDQGQVRCEIEIQKLSDPYYSMMKGISSIAPYLTAYRQGILYGKPEFAFAATDDALYMGKPSPGFYMPRRNPRLAWPSNDHVFKIHDEINHLLAKLAGLPLEKERDIESLRNHYKSNPVFISLIGGPTGIPQLIYDNPIERVQPFDRISYYFGAGVPSDFIYGNIDPNPGDWTSRAPDLYSNTGYPYQENIVGRITGWDVQDASALVVRTLFYDDIITQLADWKDTAVVQLGGGNDFQKPIIRYKIFGEALDIVKHGDPMKIETGASYFNGLTLINLLETSLDFTTKYVRENDAIFQGFSEQAINKLKKANLINRLLLSKRQLRNAIGEGLVRGKETQEMSNFIMANAHGNQHMFGMGDIGLSKLGLGRPNGILEKIFEQIATIAGVGPGISLNNHGFYSTRNVEQMNLGPSFLWIESCICGKIDGLYPQQGISQTYIHAGCNAVIAATTCSNIAGGYLEPKKTKYDFPGQTMLRYIQWKQRIKNGNYPDLHFGFLIYQDLIESLEKKDTSIGYAFREARNAYLPQDADWLVWWSPPLPQVLSGIPELDQIFYQEMAAGGPDGLDPRLDNKYMSFQEYTLYGDPAFIPYVPVHN